MRREDMEFWNGVERAISVSAREVSKAKNLEEARRRMLKLKTAIEDLRADHFLTFIDRQQELQD